MLGISETINLLLSLQAKKVKFDFILFFVRQNAIACGLSISKKLSL